MGRPASFAAVRPHIERFGRRATVVTVGDTAAPHVVSALVELTGDGVALRLGPRTRANLAARPRVTLTWLPPDGGDYQLILDGMADGFGPVDDAGVGEVSVRIDQGILHLLAGVSDGQPSCVSLQG